MKPTVFFKKLTPTAKLPAYATPGSSGADIFSDEEDSAVDRPILLSHIQEAGICLGHKQRRVISTGLAVELPMGFEIQVRSKSGRADKEGLIVLNSPGTVDSDYRGEIKVILINLGGKPIFIEKGSKIAQLVVVPVEQAIIREKEGDLSQTTRGDGGFGSTGL